MWLNTLRITPVALLPLANLAGEGYLNFHHAEGHCCRIRVVAISRSVRIRSTHAHNWPIH
jgi:hypothetical protein